MLKTIKKLLINSHFLVGSHVAILIFIFFMLMNDGHEKALYDSFVSSHTNPDMSQMDAALSLMHGTHDLFIPITGTIGNELWAIGSLRKKMFFSGSMFFVSEKSCAIFSNIFSYALRRYGITTRIAQMKYEGETCHIVAEAYIDGRWVVFDPLFDLTFVRPDGELASFEDVKNNWKYYKNQVPPNYNMIYQYEDVQYTNWKKMPFLLPFIKNVLNFAIGKDKADKISIRPYVLDKFKIYTFFLIIIYIPIIILTFISIKNTRFQTKHEHDRLLK